MGLLVKHRGGRSQCAGIEPGLRLQEIGKKYAEEMDAPKEEVMEAG